MRNSRRHLAAVLCAAVAALVPAAPLAAARLPSVLLITVDTLRADHLSSYGYERQTSPRLDRLLAGGARFTEARTPEPLTAPALASMLTSLHPHLQGSTRNGLRVRPGLESLPKALARRGYETAAMVGNWTLRSRLSGLDEHFETYREVLTRSRWFGLARREASAEDIRGEALAWLDDHLDRNPAPRFFLWVHVVEPHAPYQVHAEYLERLGLGGKRRALDERDRYDTEIAYVDDQIGLLLDAVAERVPPEEMLVLFAADHGESLGEHGYWGHGRNLHEPGLRIPMGAAWPGRVRAAAIAGPAMLLDLAPTTLGLLGLPVPPGFQGRDLSELVAVDGDGGRNGVVGGIDPARVTRYQAHKGAVLGGGSDSNRPRQRGLLEVAVIEDGHKEVLRLGGHRRSLWNLAADPGEVRTLEAVTSACSETLEAWQEEVRSGLTLADTLVPSQELSSEDEEALKALGYLD